MPEDQRPSKETTKVVSHLHVKTLILIVALDKMHLNTIDKHISIYEIKLKGC
jgi:hypothetical protein